MHTHLVVHIECDEMDLRDYRAFERAGEFSRYESTITIKCVSTGQEIVCRCHLTGGNVCWGWRYFKTEWERKHGPI